MTLNKGRVLFLLVIFFILFGYKMGEFKMNLEAVHNDPLEIDREYPASMECFYFNSNGCKLNCMKQTLILHKFSGELDIM